MTPLQDKLSYLHMKEVQVHTKDGESYEGLLDDIDVDYIELSIFNRDSTKILWLVTIPFSAIIAVNVKPETLGVKQ